jgi:RluA family pseudouridine synthase
MSLPVKLSSPETKEFWEISVLFEDDHLFVLEKPAGILTSPDRLDPVRPSLMRLLHDGIAAGKPWATSRGLNYLTNAHRPDCDTSGILLLAKNKAVLVALANLFSSGKPVKKYVALARGEPPHEAFVVDAKLSPHPTRAGFMRVDAKGGKKSQTRFEVVERFRSYTCLECFPLTYRTHQVRVHAQYTGLPLVGDTAYGGKQLWLSSLKRDYRLKPGREERPLCGAARH